MHVISRKSNCKTGSNERDDPTLVKLDRAFCNPGWELAFGNHVLTSLSSSLSDHCPLMLSSQNSPRRPPSFRFENFWTKMPGFQEVVLAAWNEPTTHTQPVHVLNHKLKHTARKLRAWSKGLFSDHKLQLIMALKVILQLDIAQESRTLSIIEKNLRSGLKKRVMGLAVLERARKRQASRITNLRVGDANTKYFHLRVNSRRRRNHIQRLQQNGGWVTAHDDKASVVLDHFTRTLGQPPPRQIDLNWEALNTGSMDLDDLALPFSEDEIKIAIEDMPKDKAPGQGLLLLMLGHHPP